jgi:hypothetical protein
MAQPRIERGISAVGGISAIYRRCVPRTTEPYSCLVRSCSCPIFPKPTDCTIFRDFSFQIPVQGKLMLGRGSSGSIDWFAFFLNAPSKTIENPRLRPSPESNGVLSAVHNRRLVQPFTADGFLTLLSRIYPGACPV